jgi:hypothetical protein
MTWQELYDTIQMVLYKLKDDNVRIYDESTGEFSEADTISFVHDDIIDNENLFIHKKETIEGF